jgi:hypothetical protein
MIMNIWRIYVRMQELKREPIPENGSVFYVSEEVLDHIFDGIE